MRKNNKLLITLISFLVVLVSVTISYYSNNDKVKEELILTFDETKSYLSSTDITPGWTSSKEFTVENKSKNTLEYDIIFDDLVNTFGASTNLLYRITSTNGYNVTDYKSVPHSSGSDIVIASKVSIPANTKHEYKIEFMYRDDHNGGDTALDLGKSFSGTLTIRKSVMIKTFLAKLLADNPTRYTVGGEDSPRSGFNTIYEADNVNTLFTTNKTEDGSTVYYFAGNAQNNWVKFAKTKSSGLCTIGEDYYSTYVNSYEEGNAEKYFITKEECAQAVACDDGYGAPFAAKNESVCVDELEGEVIASNGEFSSGTKDALWRIIRTNEDGSIRLLYSGSGNKDADYNLYGVPAYCPALFSDVSYMYGNSSDDLSILRQNTYSSPIKNDVDIFYQNVIGDTYDKYVSKTAIYCSDRSFPSGSSLENGDTFGIYDRISAYSASYKCGANKTGGLFETTQSVADKFSVSTTSGGNGDLTYPAALMTADEVVFAGGKWLTNSAAWYTHDIKGDWYTMSMSNTEYLFGLDSKGQLTEPDFCYSNGIRPVISLKSCVDWVSGDGSKTSPYVVSVDATCAASEN